MGNDDFRYLIDAIVDTSTVVLPIAFAVLMLCSNETIVCKTITSMALCGVTADGVYKTKSAWCLWALCFLVEIW